MADKWNVKDSGPRDSRAEEITDTSSFNHESLMTNNVRRVTY